MSRRVVTKSIARALLAALLAGTIACSRDDRPSFLLFVMDTTRWDAVSAYGAAVGTTPELDRLAGAGARFTRAYAQAPWTLPSHASMFTGLTPHHHRLGWKRRRVSAYTPTLADVLAADGYETVGFSENVWISDLSGLDRGFSHFTLTAPKNFEKIQNPGPPLAEAFSSWLAGRKNDRPFFAFVNVMGAHKPLEARSELLPAGTEAEDIELLIRDSGEYNCNTAGRERDMKLLRDLYLAGVADNDRQLAELRRMLAERGLPKNLITIVTADHGEQLGEHGLVDHQFSVREALVRVPLVVHGLAGVRAAVVDGPVALVDLFPSILEWAFVSKQPRNDGRPLRFDDTANERSAPRSLMSEYDELADLDTPYFGKMLRTLRRHCADADKVFGDMAAVIRFPYKLVWFSKYDSELYDLRADPQELRDLATAMPSMTAELRHEIEAVRPAAR
jgi:arylsulfatase A-like enzyme